eukprot:TRINITY_DN6149_c0_g2_i3.p1 TRINITY_DN6149_c0_g2~~TRINITY_DN6149_c0_g2_i3.p1  ORF type:complete len:401 (+),score=65.72 TRINITY_DN6149_c0_g2_i3:189-1391(+)
MVSRHESIEPAAVGAQDACRGPPFAYPQPPVVESKNLQEADSTYLAPYPPPAYRKPVHHAQTMGDLPTVVLRRNEFLGAKAVSCFKPFAAGNLVSHRKVPDENTVDSLPEQCSESETDDAAGTLQQEEEDAIIEEVGKNVIDFWNTSDPDAADPTLSCPLPGRLIGRGRLTANSSMMLLDILQPFRQLLLAGEVETATELLDALCQAEAFCSSRVSCSREKLDEQINLFADKHASQRSFDAGVEILCKARSAASPKASSPKASEPKEARSKAATAAFEEPVMEPLSDKRQAAMPWRGVVGGPRCRPQPRGLHQPATVDCLPSMTFKRRPQQLAKLPRSEDDGSGAKPPLAAQRSQDGAGSMATTRAVTGKPSRAEPKRQGKVSRQEPITVVEFEEFRLAP